MQRVKREREETRHWELRVVLPWTPVRSRLDMGGDTEMKKVNYESRKNEKQ